MSVPKSYLIIRYDFGSDTVCAPGCARRAWGLYIAQRKTEARGSERKKYQYLVYK